MSTSLLSENVSSHTFALLIGINNYAKEDMSLQGAARDAEAFKDFLESYMGVNEDRIVCILDEAATRENIIRAFKHLASNPLIQPNDPIVIFYAGHGTRVISPREWTVGPEHRPYIIEAIVPQDFCQDIGKKVDVIPDRTIEVLLRNIHDSKGDNIVVIFDCCFAGSANRNDSRRPRGINLKDYAIPQSLDYDLVHQLRQKVDIGHGALNTHVLLAACSADECAWEVGESGAFTSALLRVLISQNISELTYAKAMSLISLINQRPECIGNKSNRLFFKQAIPDGWEHCFRVNVTSDCYKLQAGTVNGISNGAEFDVYSMHPTSGSPTGPPLIRMVVKYSGKFESSLWPKNSNEAYDAKSLLKGDLVAKLVKIGSAQELCVYWGFQDLKFPDIAVNTNGVRFTRVDNEGDSFLAAYPDEHGNIALIIRVRDPEVIQWRLADRIPSTRMEYARVVLTAAARFHHLLNYAPDTKETQANKFKVQFHELSEKTIPPDAFEEQFTVKRDLYYNGKVEIVINESGIQAPYGISVLNGSLSKFWASVLFFGCSDFSIDYLCGMSLPPKGELRVGYGGVTGENPFTFDIPAGQDIDVGYFKIILSTQQVDLSHLAQPSPFSKNASGDMLQLMNEKTRAVIQNPPLFFQSSYSVIRIPVIMRRSKT